MNPRPAKDVQFFDDVRRQFGRNGAAARADAFREQVEALNAIGVRYRPLYMMMGGSDARNIWSDVGDDAILHLTHLQTNPGCNGIRAQWLVNPNFTEPTNPQILRMKMGAAEGDAGEPVSNWSDTRPSRYPLNCRMATRIDLDADAEGEPAHIRVGSQGANAPQIRSGIVFERWNLFPDSPGSTTYPQALQTGSIASGNWVVGSNPSENEARSIRGYRDQLRRIYAGRRLVAQWSGINGPAGTDNDGTIKMSISSMQWRYIFDQSVGQGGTAPAATGRGITLPLQHSAPGRRTRVRIYVRVWAAMEESVGTGQIAVYNLDDAGAMVGPTPLTNPINITGETFQWYGMSSPFNPAADAYFDGNAVRPFDRVVLCARSNSAFSFVKIGAVGLFAYHSIE